MTENTTKEIQNLAINVYNDAEYSNFMNLFHNKNYNKLRLSIDEKLSYLEAISDLETDISIHNFQIECLNKLEDYILDVYINSLEKSLLHE